jgi:hypothetical protein
VQHRFDEYHRELKRCQLLLERLEAQPTGALSEADRASKECQRNVLLNDIKRLDVLLEELCGEQQAKRHRSSFTVTVPGDKVAEAVLWQAEVVDSNVPRSVVDADALLAPDRALVTELRWLQLKLVAASAPMGEVKSMRAARSSGRRDLEVPYHPLLLLFYQAAARGQAGVEFLAEDHALPAPREDIRGCIGGVRMVPQECKADCVYNPGPDMRNTASIDANAEALGKLLQVWRSTVWQLMCRA